MIHKRYWNVRILNGLPDLFSDHSFLRYKKLVRRMIETSEMKEHSIDQINFTSNVQKTKCCEYFIGKGNCLKTCSVLNYMMECLLYERIQLLNTNIQE